MKIAMIALAFVMLLQASPEKKPEKQPELNNFPSKKGGFDTEHPPLYWTYKQENALTACTSYFTYDEKTNTCTFTVIFNIDTQVICTPLELDQNGYAILKCKYYLKDKAK